jgi:hypothetical protein
MRKIQGETEKEKKNLMYWKKYQLYNSLKPFIIFSLQYVDEKFHTEPEFQELCMSGNFFTAQVK